MKTYIHSLGIVSGNELARIDNLIHQKTVCKGEVLLHENEICCYLYFVTSGTLRSYYFNYEGNEITDCIAFPGEFMSSFSSFIRHQPSHKTIQALLDTEYQFISYDDLETLYDSSINWQKTGRRLIEQQYIIQEVHFTNYQQHNGTTRYEYLLKNYTRQVNQIPQHYIASYLGISARHLTRIRKALL